MRFVVSMKRSSQFLIALLAIFIIGVDKSFGETATERVVIVRSLDCTNGDLQDPSTCVPIAGAPFYWDVRTESGREIQTRYTIADGTDQIAYDGPVQVDVFYNHEVPWDDLGLSPMVRVARAVPTTGQTVTVDFLFVPENERVMGIGSVTFLATDCSATPETSSPELCPPIPNITISAQLQGAHSGGWRTLTDSNGVAKFEFKAPTRGLFTVPTDQSCFWDMTEFRLVPGQRQWTITMVANEDLVVVVPFRSADAYSATPVAPFLESETNKFYLTPCEM